MFCVISAVCSKTICIFLLPQQVPNEIQSQTYSKPDTLSSENALVMWEPYGCHSYVVPSATHLCIWISLRITLATRNSSVHLLKNRLCWSGLYHLSEPHPSCVHHPESPYRFVKEILKENLTWSLPSSMYRTECKISSMDVSVVFLYVWIWKKEKNL